MVVLVAGIIGVQQQQVQVPRLHRRGARLEAFQRARRHRDGRQARRAAQAFLRATVGDVDAVFVHQHGHAAQRGDAIADHQRVHLVRRLANGFRVVEHAGRGFGLHEGHQARLLAPDEFADFLGVVGLAPRFGQTHHLGALAAGHFADAIGEKAVGQQREFPPRLGEVGHGRFHARASGPRDGQVEFVLGRKGIAQQRADLVRHLEEERIQVSHHGLRHSPVNAWGHHAGAGTEKEALGRHEWRVTMRHKTQSTAPVPLAAPSEMV